MVKNAQQTGGLSVQTQLDTFGFDPATERANKLAEADDTDNRKTLLPMWDYSHGFSPALGETTYSIAENAAANKAAQGAAASGASGGNGRPAGA
jgi:hypothetical protein